MYLSAVFRLSPMCTTQNPTRSRLVIPSELSIAASIPLSRFFLLSAPFPNSKLIHHPRSISLSLEQETPTLFPSIKIEKESPKSFKK